MNDSTKVPYAPGVWQVVRYCCTSGNCFDCRGALRAAGRKRVVQGDNYSEEYAKYVASNWARYDATAELMRPMEREHS